MQERHQLRITYSCFLSKFAKQRANLNQLRPSRAAGLLATPSYSVVARAHVRYNACACVAYNLGFLTLLQLVKKVWWVHVARSTARGVWRTVSYFCCRVNHRVQKLEKGRGRSSLRYLCWSTLFCIALQYTTKSFAYLRQSDDHETVSPVNHTFVMLILIISLHRLRIFHILSIPRIVPGKLDDRVVFDVGSTYTSSILISLLQPPPHHPHIHSKDTHSVVSGIGHGIWFNVGSVPMAGGDKVHFYVCQLPCYTNIFHQFLSPCKL